MQTVLYGKYQTDGGEAREFVIGLVDPLDTYAAGILVRNGYTLQLSAEDEQDLIEQLFTARDEPIVVEEHEERAADLREHFRLQSVEAEEEMEKKEFSPLAALKWVAKQSQLQEGKGVSFTLREESANVSNTNAIKLRRLCTAGEDELCTRCGERLHGLFPETGCGNQHPHHLRCLLDLMEEGCASCKLCGKRLFQKGLLGAYFCLHQISKYVRNIRAPVRLHCFRCGQCKKFCIAFDSASQCCQLCFGSSPQRLEEVFVQRAEMQAFASGGETPVWADGMRSAPWLDFVRRKLEAIFAGEKQQRASSDIESHIPEAYKSNTGPGGDEKAKEADCLDKLINYGPFAKLGPCGELIPSPLPRMKAENDPNFSVFKMSKSLLDQDAFSTFMTETSSAKARRKQKAGPARQQTKMVFKKRHHEDGEPSETYSEPEEGWDAGLKESSPEQETEEQFEAKCIRENQQELQFLFTGQPRPGKERKNKGTL